MTKPPNEVQGMNQSFIPTLGSDFEHAIDIVIKRGPKHRQAPRQSECTC
jgi:hypothetical protein